MIIFVGGLIGAGKSSVATALAEHLGLAYYDVDEPKLSVYQQDPDYDYNMENGIPFKADTRLKVYRQVVSDFAVLTQTHKHLVVEEALHKRELRRHLFEGAEKYFGGYIVVWVKASEKVILERLTVKKREGHLLKNPVIMHKAFLKEFEPFEQSIIICRNENSLEETIQELSDLFEKIAACSNLC